MRDRRPSPRPVLAALSAAVVATILLAMGLAAAQDEGDVDDLRQQREDNRREAADVAAELDALAAEDQELQDAIEALESHIALQEARIVAAEDAIADAEALAAAARAEADALDGEMDDIRSRLQRAVVNAFVAPRLDTLEQLDSDNLLETEIKRSYIDEVVGDEYDLLDDLRVAQAEQDDAERRAETAAAEAQAQADALELRLEQLDESKAEVEELRSQVAVRVADWQAVEAEIDAADAAIARQIRELEAELARQAAEAEARRLAEEEARRLAEEEAANGEEPDAADDPADDPADDEEGDEDETVPAPPVDLGPFQVTHRPVTGSITSRFGSRVHPIFGTTRNHYGVDFGGNTGEPIVAAAPGVVLTAGWMNGYGNTVVVSHGDGFTTLYAHQNEILVSTGDSVAGGDLIGRVGSTGWSTGPHLHWEIRVDGVAVDPEPYLA